MPQSALKVLARIHHGVSSGGGLADLALSSESRRLGLVPGSAGVTREETEFYIA